MNSADRGDNRVREPIRDPTPKTVARRVRLSYGTGEGRIELIEEKLHWPGRKRSPRIGLRDRTDHHVIAARGGSPRKHESCKPKSRGQEAMYGKSRNAAAGKDRDPTSATCPHVVKTDKKETDTGDPPKETAIAILSRIGRQNKCPKKGWSDGQPKNGLKGEAGFRLFVAPQADRDGGHQTDQDQNTRADHAHRAYDFCSRIAVCKEHIFDQVAADDPRREKIKKISDKPETGRATRRLRNPESIVQPFPTDKGQKDRAKNYREPEQEKMPIGLRTKKATQ